MSNVLAPLLRIEERALSIGLWLKGSSKREIGLAQPCGFKEALAGAQRKPLRPFRAYHDFCPDTLHDFYFSRFPKSMGYGASRGVDIV